MNAPFGSQASTNRSRLTAGTLSLPAMAYMARGDDAYK